MQKVRAAKKEKGREDNKTKLELKVEAAQPELHGDTIQQVSEQDEAKKEAQGLRDKIKELEEALAAASAPAKK